MKRACLAGILLSFTLPAFAAEPSPSALMLELPEIPSTLQPESCDAADALLARAEEQAMADMMRSQQLAMSGMSAGASAVSDSQGDLIARLLDPASMTCEMNIAQAQSGIDVAEDYRREQWNLDARIEDDVETKCPVIGMADYRDPGCVNPIRKRGLAEQREALARFIANANAQLRKARGDYAQCSKSREELAAQATAAKLPAQYLAIAQGAATNGWQQLSVLTDQFRSLCETAASAASQIKERERAW